MCVSLHDFVLSVNQANFVPRVAAINNESHNTVTWSKAQFHRGDTFALRQMDTRLRIRGTRQ
jgi:hypothetical protein